MAVTTVAGMYRGFGSILLLFAGVVQGLSLCPCRAEQLAGPVVSHGYAGGDADGRADCGSLCTSWGPCSTRFCDSHIQAKSNERTGVAVASAAFAEFDVICWAEPRVPLTAYPASDPPASASGLLSRSTPLLI
jgi:hypothetical protein